MNPNPSPTSHRRVPALLRLAVALVVGAVVVACTVNLLVQLAG
jgi:hypothetical protein